MSNLPSIGFIGLGAMGGPMVANLLKAGYPVCGFDLNADCVQTCTKSGMQAAASVADVIAQSDWVLTSLPSSDAFVQVAEEHLLSHARQGQIFIDLGTVTPPEARRLAGLFLEKGVFLIDAPVSGGPAGAERGDLYIFVGGDEAVYWQCHALLKVLGEPSRITYCGPSGHGQIVKGVNQLMMGLGDAAYLEAVAFGVRAGVNAEVIAQAIGDTGRWRTDFNAIARRVAQGTGEQIGVKFRELPYFLREASVQGFTLPLTEALYNFCDAGERVVIDDNRPAPSFWWQLTSVD